MFELPGYIMHLQTHTELEDSGNKVRVIMEYTYKHQ